MFGIGALSFAAPWALVTLVALPAIWWLLRLTPPIPKRFVFPPIRLLLGITAERETPAQTPWWLLLLRLLIAALVIFGASRPLLNAEPPLEGQGPVIVVVDNGWSAAAGWEARHRVLQGIVDKAARGDRRIVMMETAPPADGGAVTVKALGPTEAKTAAARMTPQPWPVRRDLAAEALAGWAEGFKDIADVRWLSDGIAGPGDEVLAERLDALGRLHVYGMTGMSAPLLRLPRPEPEGLVSEIERADVATAATYEVRGLDAEGQVIVVGQAGMDAGTTRTEVSLKAPPEILNRVERMQIGAGETVGAVTLLDGRWRRRPVGLVSVGGIGEAQPLLGRLYYIERALRNATTLRTGGVTPLLAQPLSMLVLADPGELPAAEVAAIEDWMERGGMTVRFAGPALARRSTEESPTAAATPDPLLPVTLRGGDRVIGGAMSWRQPMGLQAFPAAGPFAGLVVPPDVKVRRQILAQPTPDLSEKTWAALSDGTPLVTAERKGKGWLVLFHTSANAEWSNLPLSGVFVEMMARLLTLGQGVDAVGDTPPLAPIKTLDAFARAGDPPAVARAVTVAELPDLVPSPQHPPGIYGAADLKRAFNLPGALEPLEPLDLARDGVTRLDYVAPKESDLGGALLAAALLLFMLDLLAGLWVRGGGRRRMAAAAVLFGVLLAGGSASAAPDEKFARENSLETRLAYLKTGDERLDNVSRLGLNGLTIMLARRTAAELGPPQAVDPSRDELAFFPLIYWPVTEDYRIDDTARLAVKAYLRNGGTILFDGRDQGGIAQTQALRHIAEILDLPALVPVPTNHVIGRAFYLLNDFPGRFAGSQVWIERAGERVNDGVSPVIAGSNDWAAAWALDDAQRPLFPVVPGGERQRELAFRFGINLVMHVLTGNYKSDQVHLRSILKRLGE